MDEPIQEISNGRTHCSRTRNKPEYLIARLQLTERGPLGFGPIQIFDGTKLPLDSDHRHIFVLYSSPKKVVCSSREFLAQTLQVCE